MAGNASYTTSLRPRTLVVPHTLPALGVHVLMASLSMPRCMRGGLGGFTESEDSMTSHQLEASLSTAFL